NRGLLNIRFLRRRRTQRHGKRCEAAQDTRARFGRTPANARIQTSEAVSVLNSQRGLANATHALHRRATDRRLRHGGGLVMHQDGVELIKFAGAAREARDARGGTPMNGRGGGSNAYERSSAAATLRLP